MKKLLLILLVLVIAAPALAQSWVTANQVTLAWDAVPKVQTTDAANKYQLSGNAGSAGVPNYGGMNWIHPVRCDTGIFGVLSGTGATFIVYYAKIE